MWKTEDSILETVNSVTMGRETNGIGKILLFRLFCFAPTGPLPGRRGVFSLPVANSRGSYLGLRRLPEGLSTAEPTLTASLAHRHETDTQARHCGSNLGSNAFWKYLLYVL